LLLYFALHAALFAFDLHNPDAFLRGDRAGPRLELVEQAQRAGASGLGHLFLATGLPGDYIVFLPFYAPFGQYGVILVQLLVGALTLLITAGLAISLGASARTATAAGALYCLLPGALMDPHLLVTESFFTAAFCGALWALTHAARAGSSRNVWLGMGLLTLAAFIRPQALPLGLVAAVPLFVMSPRLRRDAALAPLLWLLVFPGTWLLWRYLQVGEFGLGPSMFDIGINLKIRADRIALITPIPGWVPMDWTSPNPARMTVAAFLDLSTHYPRALISTLVSDLMNFVANPGANALFGIYLQYYTPSSDVFFWKHTIDSGGFSAVVREVFGTNGNGRLALVFVLTGALQAVAIVGAVLGTAHVLLRRESQRAAVVVMLVCLAESAVVFVAGIVRWTHRAPLEPVIAALAVIGLAWAVGQLRPRRTSALQPRAPA
jgi:4-amino-4-deoxy-L-arabinose transferase-like glycosyltransferase